MFKNFLLLNAGVGFFLFGFGYMIGFSQNTAPVSTSFAIGSYQGNATNISGTALNWAGWNPSKKSKFNRPIRATVIVESISGLSATWAYTINYYGTVYSGKYTGLKYAAFWFPDSAAINDSPVPDSLFYIVPDSTGMSVGDEFVLTNYKIQQGDQYNFRLVFSSGYAKGTQALQSQPVWIGYGVQSMAFGFMPDEEARLVYRTLYATKYDGTFVVFFSSDTLADTTWTKAASLSAWNYKTITGIDNMPWMKVERIGQIEADTTLIWGEDVIIQSQ